MAPAATEQVGLAAGREVKAAGEVSERTERPKSWPVVIACVFGVLAALWVFLVGLQLLGDSFKTLGGRGSGKMFKAVDNPIAGLMTGVLATVLVQSSSTSTSIVVGLVGAGQISVRSGIPIIMGANIGTSVTNTIVSMGQAGDRVQLQRAFSGATVHDMFNLLTVATLLPIELIIGALEGEGGPLYWITKAIADAIMSGKEGSKLFHSPIKAITSPVTKLFLNNNKYVIYGLSLGAPKAEAAVAVNGTSCEPLPGGSRRLREPEAEVTGAARALLSRRLGDGLADCSEYYCVSGSLDKNFKKISKSAYKKKLTKCKGYITEPASPCDSAAKEKCYLDAGKYYVDYVEKKPIIKGGMVDGMSDTAGGLICLIISLILLCGGLFCLVKILQFLFMGTAKATIVRATRLNDYLAILVGTGITIVVQSSSVTTSALTPFCGLGLLPLEKMLPLTVGANIGTTVTALIASVAVFTHDAIHIALCHLFFNLFGVAIWFPAPFMRQVPLSAARLLGLYASYFRAVPLLYILITFVVVPGIALGVSTLYGVSVPAGVILTLVILGALAGFVAWWVKLGCYRVLSREQREQGRRQLEDADRKLRGEPAPEAAEAAEAADGERADTNV